MRKFKTFLEGLNNEELTMMNDHISNGVAAEMVKLHREAQATAVCPVCERLVDEQQDLVLLFGPNGFRQKARFCGHDCLEYFLQMRKRHTQSLNNLHEDEL